MPIPLPYFAYGSNLLSARLQARCPSARPLGVGWLGGHSLDFSKHGRDGSGKATITQGAGRVPGVLFTIAPPDLPALDRAEGAGRHYDKIEVTLEDGTRATTYRALLRRDGLAPFDWYLALIRAGRGEHGLGVADLAGIVALSDPDPTRAARLEAHRALTISGHADWCTPL